MEIVINVNGSPLVISPETIKATREWFAENIRGCIKSAEAGEWHVNNLPRYVDWQTGNMADALAGEWDQTLTFLQRAVFIQTGESVPLLSDGRSYDYICKRG